jgi:hypothetical protein
MSAPGDKVEAFIGSKKNLHLAVESGRPFLVQASWRSSSEIVVLLLSNLYGKLLVLGLVIFTSLMDGQFIFISFLMATRL